MTSRIVVTCGTPGKCRRRREEVLANKLARGRVRRPGAVSSARRGRAWLGCVRERGLERSRRAPPRARPRAMRPLHLRRTRPAEERRLRRRVRRRGGVRTALTRLSLPARGEARSGRPRGSRRTSNVRGEYGLERPIEGEPVGVAAVPGGGGFAQRRPGRVHAEDCGRQLRGLDGVGHGSVLAFLDELGGGVVRAASRPRSARRVPRLRRPRGRNPRAWTGNARQSARRSVARNRSSPPRTQGLAPHQRAPYSAIKRSTSGRAGPLPKITPRSSGTRCARKSDGGYKGGRLLLRDVSPGEDDDRLGGLGAACRRGRRRFPRAPSRRPAGPAPEAVVRTTARSRRPVAAPGYSDVAPRARFAPRLVPGSRASTHSTRPRTNRRRSEIDAAAEPAQPRAARSTGTKQCGPRHSEHRRGLDVVRDPQPKRRAGAIRLRPPAV